MYKYRRSIGYPCEVCGNEFGLKFNLLLNSGEEIIYLRCPYCKQENTINKSRYIKKFKNNGR